jgi:hypothetical protein
MGAPALDNVLATLTPERIKARELEQWCSHQAGECLKAHGLILDEASRLRVCKAVANAMQQASLDLCGLAAGGYAVTVTKPASRTARSPVPKFPSSLVFDTLIEGWAAERRPTEKTYYEWSRVLRQLAAFVRHDDARRLTADDFVAWKGSLVAAGLRPQTVRDAKITPARAILNGAWTIAY